jgi:hypothetical protein
MCLYQRRRLEDVEVSGAERKGWAGDVNAGVFELALDEEGDGDETAGGGLGEVSGPLVDTDGADDLVGLGDFVGLREDGPVRESCDTKNRVEEFGSHRSANEIRR